MSDLLRGGRLPTVRRDVVRFTSSVKSDQRMLKSIIGINKAHVAMMVEQGIVTPTEGARLLRALGGLKGDARLRSTLEDAHMYVEEEVARAAGPEAGGNLHIAKSRNDQVATAIRMRLRRDLLTMLSSLGGLQDALISLANAHKETIVLGYTHLQPAQPVTFGHHLLAYVDAFERDAQRLEEAYMRVNLSPMGACALATTSLPISRERVAELLGFDGVVENSIDAVSSRDFILETVACLALLAVDVSRMAEDLIVWSTCEFGVVVIPDQFASTSSIMPQKKNPDVLEVVRARMSHVIGDLVACIATIKALPSTYNLDLQEVTPRLWSAVDTVKESLNMLSKLVPGLKVREDLSMRALSTFSTTTELANMLVRKHGVPFRTSHRVVGALVSHLIKKGLSALEITPELLKEAAKDHAGISLNVSEEDIRSSVDPVGFVEAHHVRGGPAPKEVARMIGVRKHWVASTGEWVSEKMGSLREADRRLESVIDQIIS